MKEDSQDIFPHLLMIFLLEKYNSPNRMVPLNEFIVNSKIGNTPNVIASKTKDILTLLEEGKKLEWYVNSSEMYLSKEGINKGLIKNKEDFATGDNTLDRYNISAQLTIDGLDYSLNLIRSQKELTSVLDTNKSVRKTNKWMRVLTGALVAVALIGLFREILKDRHTLEPEQQLQMKLQLLDSTVKSQLKKDSLFQTKLKDSPRIMVTIPTKK